MELQTAFYILGIIFMAIMLILLIALVVSVLVIRAKVVEIQTQIQDKINEITHIADRGSDLMSGVGGKVVGAAADAVASLIDSSRNKKKRR